MYSIFSSFKMVSRRVWMRSMTAPKKRRRFQRCHGQRLGKAPLVGGVKGAAGEHGRKAPGGKSRLRARAQFLVGAKALVGREQEHLPVAHAVEVHKRSCPPSHARVACGTASSRSAPLPRCQTALRPRGPRRSLGRRASSVRSATTPEVLSFMVWRLGFPARTSAESEHAQQYAHRRRNAHRRGQPGDQKGAQRGGQRPASASAKAA